MKKLSFYLLISLVVVGAYGQPENSVQNKTNKKLKNRQIVEKRATKEDSIAVMIDYMVYNRKFILKPAYIKINQGLIPNANSEFNFLSIDSNRIIIRMEANPHLIKGPFYESGQSYIDHTVIEELIIVGTIIKFEVKKKKNPDKGYTIGLEFITEMSNSFEIVIDITRTGKAYAIIDKKNLAINSQEPSVFSRTYNFINYAFPIYFNGSLVTLESSIISMAHSLY